MWNDALTLAEDHMGLDRGTARGTVLIETLPAAFEMDEILYELREHSAGLNAGRWDYIFSAIKRFSERPEFVTPDRAAVTMTVPFMHAYSELLVKTCHRRGAHAMGGMCGGDPLAHRRGGGAEGARRRALGQAARGGRRVRRHLGRPPRLGGARHGRVRQGARRPRQPGRQAARRRRRGGRRPAGDRQDRGRDHREGPALERERGHPVHLVVAARQRRRGHLRADGGRRHGGDLALPGLAVDPPRGHAGRRPHGHARAGARAGRRGARDDPRGDRRRRVVRARGPPAGVARDLRGGGAERATTVRGVPDAAGLRQARGDRERRDCASPAGPMPRRPHDRPRVNTGGRLHPVPWVQIWTTIRPVRPGPCVRPATREGRQSPRAHMCA